VRFATADVTRLPVPDGHADLYVSFETIEHVADDRGVVAEAARVLKPSGTFLCSTPNREVVNPGNSIEDAPGNPYHVREYAQHELESLLRARFGQVAWYGQTFLPGGYFRLLIRLGRFHRKLARRFHQAQKVCGLLWRSRSTHSQRR
jgi:SAM-dependent methyltransferase